MRPKTKDGSQNNLKIEIRGEKNLCRKSVFCHNELHNLNISSYFEMERQRECACVCVCAYGCVCVSVCVCECVRGSERETDKETEREKERSHCRRCLDEVSSASN